MQRSPSPTSLFIGAVFIALLVYAAGIFALSADTANQPIIESFTADRLTVDYLEVEEGIEAVNMSWKAVGLASDHTMRMEAWVGERWVLIGEGFAPKKTDRIVISHPLTFDNPLYRLSVVNRSGQIVAEKSLELSYTETTTQPQIAQFVAPVGGGVLADDLQRGGITVPVLWRIQDRAYSQQPVIEQVLMPSGEVVGTPMRDLTHWLPRQGEGQITLAPVEGDTVFLRMRVLDRHTEATLTEQLITLPVVTENQVVINSDEWLRFDAVTVEHVNSILTAGQERGNKPDVLLKIGDSNIADDATLCNFDKDNYDIGAYTHLQPMVDRFAPSFCTSTAASMRGLGTNALFDPMWAAMRDCLPNETPLDCAIREHQPAYALIYIGIQDLESLAQNPDRPMQSYRSNLKNIVKQLEANGILPILTTFPTSYTFHNDGTSDALNDMIRDLAAARHLPLIDLRAYTAHYPNRGVDVDGFHMSTPPGGRTSFTGNEMIYARTLYELLVLELLHQLTTDHELQFNNSSSPPLTGSDIQKQAAVPPERQAAHS